MERKGWGTTGRVEERGDTSLIILLFALNCIDFFFQDVSLWTKELTKKSQNIISRINIKAIIFLFFTNVLIKNCID